MHFHRANVTGDDDSDEDQEFYNSAEEETIDQLLLLSEDDKHLPLMKRKKSKIQKNPKRMKLFREKLLKRPIFQLKNDPIFEFDPPPEPPPPPAAVFDSETESDIGSDTDRGHQEDLFDAIPPELADNIPQEYKTMMNFMGGSSSASPRLVMEKRLKKRDVEERRNRFLIPQRKMCTNFLDVEEEDELNAQSWWMVEIIEPDCSVSSITLSKWETRKGPAYVFITEWNGLVERNELKEGDLMQLWSFRASGGVGDRGGRGRLCFMLLEIGERDEGEVPSLLESRG